ncbi:hypothetical protein [Streptomyces sp. NPDC056480]|uniref:hypothetical protein n=1 Tax=Streptomyces sp. NPDC056480 TaxID=3345833 RepID=UPI0036BA1E22
MSTNVTGFGMPFKLPDLSRVSADTIRLLLQELQTSTSPEPIYDELSSQWRSQGLGVPGIRDVSPIGAFGDSGEMRAILSDLTDPVVSQEAA